MRKSGWHLIVRQQWCFTASHFNIIPFFIEFSLWMSSHLRWWYYCYCQIFNIQRKILTFWEHIFSVKIAWLSDVYHVFILEIRFDLMQKRNAMHSINNKNIISIQMIDKSFFMDAAHLFTFFIVLLLDFASLVSVSFLFIRNSVFCAYPPGWTIVYVNFSAKNMSQCYHLIRLCSSKYFLFSLCYALGQMALNILLDR